ncbi:MAG: DUF3859 domain-containing protein [Bauldia litoralis]
MIARLLLLLVLVAAPLIGPPGAALAGDKESTGIEIFESGIYRLRITGYTKAPRDIAGERFLADNVELFRDTRQILAQPKLTFGFGYRITDPALVGKRLTLELRFPEMTNPATGKKATSLTDSFIAMPGIRRELFRFDHTWEMAEGIWTYRLLADGKVLATVSFKVFVGLN